MKKKKFSAVKAVKELSRKKFAKLPKQKVIPNKKKKKPKYKENFENEHF